MQEIHLYLQNILLISQLSLETCDKLHIILKILINKTKQDQVQIQANDELYST